MLEPTMTGLLALGSLFAQTGQPFQVIFANPPYAIGWGTLALINAGLAQGKFRGGLAWFVVSLFLGPLATLVLVLLDRRPPPPEPD